MSNPLSFIILSINYHIIIIRVDLFDLVFGFQEKQVSASVDTIDEATGCQRKEQQRVDTIDTQVDGIETPSGWWRGSCR